MSPKMSDCELDRQPTGPVELTEAGDYQRQQTRGPTLADDQDWAAPGDAVASVQRTLRTHTTRRWLIPHVIAAAHNHSVSV